jgi:DNA-binding transcriptional regulator YdaS (Cro superfamily)
MVYPVAEAVKYLGGPAKVARMGGVTPWAVSKWIRLGLPPGRVIWLASQTGFRWTPHELAPQIYPYKRDGLPHKLRRELAA